MEEVIVDIKTTQRSVNETDGSLTIRIKDSADDSSDNAAKTKAKTTVICRYFKRNGTCKREDCNFLHEQKKCKFFESKMGCRDGDNCLLQHYRAEADASIEETYEDEQINTEFIEGKQLEHEFKKLSLLESEKKNNVSDRSKKLCRFMKRGKCNKEHCPNKHEIKTSENVQNPKVNHEGKKVEFCNKNVGMAHLKKSFENWKQIDQPPSEDGESQRQTENANICRYFNTRKGCLKGNKCPHRHEMIEKKFISENEDTSNAIKEKRYNLKDESVGDENLVEENSEGKTTKTVKRKCRFFSTKNGCRDGENCLFIHQSKSLEKDQDILQVGQTQKHCQFHNSNKGCLKGKYCPNLHKGDSFQPDKSDIVMVKSSAELRATELKQLEKRWEDHYECKQTEPTAIYNVKISPTDPDWPFVVREFIVQVEFPGEYPEKLFTVVLQESDQFPPYFCQFMNEILQNWCDMRIKQRNGQDLAFRPFCRWFDKELSNNFQFAANKVKLQMQANAFGITLVHHKSILPQTTPSSTMESKKEEEEEEEEGGGGGEGDCNDGDETQQDNSTVDAQNELFTDETERNDDKCSSNVKKGTEVKLPNLFLSQSVGTLRIRSGLLVVQCERCRTKHDYSVFTKQKAKGTCKQCHLEQSVVYHSELMHHFSPVVGYLHLANCKAFDFILNDSSIIVNCLQCNKNNTLKGLLTSSKKEFWCQHCHEKIEIKIAYVKFSLLEPSGASIVSTNKKSNKDTQEASKKKVPKEPGFKEGQALPSNGACKHYKKSHRWLRFPCCGKAYPCDICHEEGENGDHEMKFANKMICGFCSKEQPFFKDKPCVSCKSGVTKGRSTHWEGGKGCRDKSKMARGDKHKTAGQGKTISRKKDEDSQKKK